MPKESQPEDGKEKVKGWIKAFQLYHDQEAQDKLVHHYKNLVESIAYKYSRGRSYHDDIVQVGMIGLLGAIRRYDESLGRSFEAFAVPTIVGEIKRFLRDKTWSVYVPRRLKELGLHVKKAVEYLTSELHRSPKIDEIARHLGVTEEEVLVAMEMGIHYQALSMDHLSEVDADGGAVTLLELLGRIDENYEKVNEKLTLEHMLHLLTEREKQIIQLTYIEGLNQTETGKRLNISQMHVSRLQRRAIKKLREAIHVKM